MNRSISERARCIKLNAVLEKKFWAKVVGMACYLINMSPRVALDGKVTWEVWTGNEVDYSGLRVFGCPTYAHIAGEERSKLDAKSRQCIYLGYQKGVKGFKLWDMKANKAVISRDLIFDEKAMLQNTQKVVWYGWSYRQGELVLRMQRMILRMQGELVQKINNFIE